MADSEQDNSRLLVSCELCEGLVPGSALRAERYYRLADEGDADVREVATRLVCADVTACYARALRPDEWTRLSMWVRIVCAPYDGRRCGCATSAMSLRRGMSSRSVVCVTRTAGGP
jgi:hypothetical protein